MGNLGNGSALQKAILAREGKAAWGMPASAAISRTHLNSGKFLLPNPYFLPQCRLTLFLTPTHFWSLSTLKVAESRGIGEKRYTGSSEMEREDQQRLEICLYQGNMP